MNELERIECLLNVIKSQIDEMDYYEMEEAKERVKNVVSDIFSFKIKEHSFDVTADRFDKNDEDTYGDEICELDYEIESEDVDIIIIPVTNELRDNIEKVTQISVVINQ